MVWIKHTKDRGSSLSGGVSQILSYHEFIYRLAIGLRIDDNVIVLRQQRIGEYYCCYVYNTTVSWLVCVRMRAFSNCQSVSVERCP